MKARSQQGFAFLELVLIVGVVVLAGFLGYTAYNAYQNKGNTASTPSNANVASTAADVPVAPTVSDTSGLDQATATLNQADPNTSSADSSQLDTQMNF